MDKKRYMLCRLMPANYQNGNTKKAMTRNITKSVQLAMSDELDALKEYAYSIRALSPLYIEDKESGERVFQIEK